MHLKSYFQPLAALVPMRIIELLLFNFTVRVNICLCLHRVGIGKRSSNPLPHLTIQTTDLIQLLATLAEKSRFNRIVVTFDDGYSDALDFVEKHSVLKEFQNIEWILFVCPRKLLSRIGFKWDLYESMGMAKRGINLMKFLDEKTDPEIDCYLEKVLDNEEFALAHEQDLMRVSKRRNVRLGNHSNNHPRFSLLSDSDSQKEIQGSHDLMLNRFGAYEHFAFPVGRFGVDFNLREVAYLKSLGIKYLWSTNQAVFTDHEFEHAKYLPRIGINGLLSPKLNLLKIIGYTVISRIRNSWRFGGE